jgi:hypothetical protein
MGIDFIFLLPIGEIKTKIINFFNN